MEAVFAVFADPLFSGPPPPFETFFKPDADFSPAFPWILARCKLINKLGGPRMRVVHWKTLEVLGHINQVLRSGPEIAVPVQALVARPGPS